MQHGEYSRTDGGPAGGVYARFFMEPVQDMLASAENGRPIFKEEERVEIIIPGNQYLAPVKRVSDEERNRFPREYEAFRKGIEAIPDGTPLSEWPILNRAQIAELGALGFRTVEDIRAASDTVIQGIGRGAYGLREKAKAWLDEAEGTALTEKLSLENDQLRMEVSNLQRQVAEQGELVRQLHSESMARRNELPSMETMRTADIDPLARIAPQATQAAESSLSGFDAPRRRGRPPRQPEASA